MIYKCKKDCFDSNKGIYYKAGVLYPYVPEVLKKHFIPLSVETNVNEKAMQEEVKLLTIKLGLDNTGLQEIMRTYHIKPGRGAEKELIPILKDLLRKQEEENKKKKNK